jgi:multiple sugar transport system permease protein
MATDTRTLQSSGSRWTRFPGKLSNSLVYLVLILGVSITLLPFVWMILGSFKTPSELIQVPPTFWPENPTRCHGIIPC